MRTYFLFGLTLSLAIGCSSSYSVRNEPAPDEYFFAQVNENAKKKSLVISTMSGEKIGATDLFVRADSTTFLQSTSGKRITIPTSSLRAITIRNAGRGAVDGLLPGAIVGVAAGIYLIQLFSEAFEGLSAEGYLILGGGSIAGGVLLGAGVGAIIGHTDEYIFQSQSNNSKGNR